MRILMWIGGVVVGLIVLRFVLVFVVRRLIAARIKAEGELFTVPVTGSAFDPRFRNEETGAMAARLIATWKHPLPRDEVEMRSGGFGYTPKKVPSADDCKEGKVKGIITDPRTLYPVDVEALGYEPV